MLKMKLSSSSEKPSLIMISVKTAVCIYDFSSGLTDMAEIALADIILLSHLYSHNLLNEIKRRFRHFCAKRRDWFFRPAFMRTPCCVVCTNHLSTYPKQAGRRPIGTYF